MRRRAAGLGLAVVLAALAAGAATRAQDAADRTNKVHYWPHRVFSIPVDVAAVERSSNVPTYLQLYSSLARGPWQAGPKLALGSLVLLKNGKKGFEFNSDRDGEYEFSVQYHYGDGSSTPRNLEELSAMLRVTIDTTLPTVRVNAVGNGVEWSAADDNLDPESVRLQAKFPSWPEWRTVDTRAFRPQDNYAWKLQPGQVLDVRVLARDRAGNENFSVPVQVPGTGGGGGFPTGFPRPGSDAPLPGGGGGSGGLPQPRVDYVRTPNFDIDYKIDRAGRSGIQAAQLYVQKDRGGWQATKRYTVDPPATTGQNLKLAYTTDAAAEGVYGFYVAPESGAGVKADPPLAAAPPMVYVVYDKTPPFVKLTGVRVGAGGKHGPLVELMWETYDQNLLADPVTLEYSIDKNAAQWQEIASRQPPGAERYDAEQKLKRYVGQYRWEIADEKLWKFYVRARCVDKAGNSTTDVSADPVLVDLEKPAASITGVRGSGAVPPERPAPPAPRPNPPRATPAPVTPTPPAEPPAGGPVLPMLPSAPPS